MEAKVIEVGTADFAIGMAGQILETKGIGSCIVVCLYDKNNKIGALSHIMLAHSGGNSLNELRFVDTALPNVLGKLIDLGVNIDDLEAHLVGGASMFTDFEDYLKLGSENIAAVEKFLASINVPIKSKEVGGNIGRSVKFILDTGEIIITIK
jgi:chemotaxis protein CheD